MLESNKINAEGNQYSALTKPCIVRTPEVVRVNKLIQVNSGQGEGDTKWKGWPWKLLLLKLDMIYLEYFINTTFIANIVTLCIAKVDISFALEDFINYRLAY